MLSGSSAIHPVPDGWQFNDLLLEFGQKAATIGGKENLFPTEFILMPTVCKHPQVRIVSRHDDVEFVECLECGEVFDSEEFQDIAIEESGIEPDAETAEDE